MRFVYFVLFLLFLVGCQNVDSGLDTRVDILYEHTIQMKVLSTPEVLDEIGLDVSILKSSDGLSSLEKVELLERSFAVEGSGKLIERVKVLENRMNEMMESWYVLTSD